MVGEAKTIDNKGTAGLRVGSPESGAEDIWGVLLRDTCEEGRKEGLGQGRSSHNAFQQIQWGTLGLGDTLQLSHHAAIGLRVPSGRGEPLGKGSSRWAWAFPKIPCEQGQVPEFYVGKDNAHKGQ